MKIHFIGIGGIGVSALAQYYLEKRYQVSGSDLVSSEITEFLQKKGIEVLIGNKEENIKKDFDLVVHSPAVNSDNPEYKKAKELGVRLQSYSEALGQLTKEYNTIAISGSHGKSTTTAMIALVLIKAGIDPTVIVGTKLKEFSRERDAAAREGTNFRMGRSKYLVIEACEYDSSFNQYFPKITVVTNVDKEHLDYFKTFANVVKTFKEFILKLPKDGFLVANKDDKNLVRIAKEIATTRARGRGSRNDVIASAFSREQQRGGKQTFYSLKQKESAKLKKILKVPGQHNVSNALAVLVVARILGIKDAITFKSLSEFKGTWRRFETKTAELRGISRKKTRKITVVSDYGHHPTEVFVTLNAAREKYPTKKIWCVFQPHQYQRTYYLFNDFVKLFKKVPIDNIIITDIYDVAGREEKTINQKVSSKILVKKIARKNVQYMPIDDAEKFVKENIKSGEVLIIMGAGDIYKLFYKF